MDRQHLQTLAAEPRGRSAPPPAFLRFAFHLEFTRPVHFHFNHGGVLMGLLARALETHDLPIGLIPFACESGRVRFREGEPYKIGVTLCGQPHDIGGQERVIENGLDRIGRERRPANGPPATLHGNFRLVRTEQETTLDLRAQFERALALCGMLHLRFVSPTRIERPMGLSERGAGYLNADCFPADHFLRRLWARLFFLREGRRAGPDDWARQCPSIPAETEASDARFLWLDVPITGGSRETDPNRPKGHTTGGVLGSVMLEGVPDDWLPYLVAGQYLHVGEKTHYGLGAYRIDGLQAAGAATCEEFFRPARTIVDLAAQPDALAAAFEHVVTHSVAAGVDGITPDAAAADRPRIIETLAATVRNGGYHPEPLAGIVGRKANGTPRALAIPTIEDRTLQRAAFDVLAPALDTLLEDCSFAYRRGLSRSGAAQAIRRAWDDGYRWVLDADIESFFDAVDWDRLMFKVRALYPFDPIADTIEDWVKAPVLFQGMKIRRSRGLPQGAVISPLLANLYLDELDERVLGKNHRMVRYADDFVVLCKDPDEARRAQAEVQAILGDMGLTLNPDKTSVQSLEAGFTYLGYLFCRSLVLQREGGKDAGRTSADEDLHVPPRSWLAQVPLEELRALRAPRPQPGPRLAQPITSGGSAAAPAQRAVYLTDPSLRAFVRDEALVLVAPPRPEQEIPLRSISHLVTIGRSRMTIPLLLTMGSLGIPCFFCRRSGEVLQVFWPAAPKWELWEAQGRRAANPESSLEFAKGIVQAKLHNTATIAMRLKLAKCQELAADLRDLERSCLEQTTKAALMGLEGRGAALHFASIQETLAPAWGFAGRRKHPSPDPVNAALSLGYTVLYNHAVCALLAAGLNPRIGVFHEERGAYYALASDVQEEFRHLVDSFVLGRINKGQIKTGDFVHSSDGRYPCLMKPDARKDFIVDLESRLLTEFTPPGWDEPVSYLAFLSAQARAIRDWAESKIEAYEPLRIHG